MRLEEIIRSMRVARALPGDEELRQLPYRRAFIYGRVSSQAQVRESEESIREVARLVMLAKKDGYKTSLKSEAVEKWLDLLQAGTETNKVIEEGEVTVDCRDLGLSGSLGEDRRPGLASLWRRVETGDTGAVYLTEGMSRLSRDRDRVLGYKLLKLLKEKQCRVRTPEGVYNPAISRDWDYLAEDVEDSAEEMKKAGIRLGRRRLAKAGEGKHVGNPVCPGYVVSIEGQRRDGSYIFGKWQLYPPHQKVAVECLEEIVRQHSLYKAAQALQARQAVFPFFPEELRYMRTRSLLRRCLKNTTGYVISYNALKGLATNLKLIGIWQWRDILIENNHPAAVSADLFLQAYETAKSDKPKGRAAYAEPLEWAGLIYCCNHDEPRKVSALNRERRWACRSQFSSEAPCLQIADHLITPPLTRALLDCLDLTPHAEAVLEKLKSEVSQNSLEEGQRRKRENELKAHIANLERYLGCGDPEREETYWRLIREERAKLEQLRQRPEIPRATSLDLEKVAHFLENLNSEWQRYPSWLRNRLIKLLIDRVELRHDANHIEAIIYWKVGLRQVVNIRRLSTNFAKEKLWRSEDVSLLKVLWPSSSREVIMAAFPGRTWVAICQKAGSLTINRKTVRGAIQKGRRWTEEEKKRLKELYSSEASVDNIARDLQRSRQTVIGKASALKLSRPRELRYKRREPSWEPVTIKLFQESSSP
jgi:DNA invertase Pin-like site-specific DNA recombinase